MIKDIKSYRQGFMDGLDIKENQKYKLFGFELNEILDILEDKMSTKPLMTRAEAIEKIFPIFGNSLLAEKLIDFYIAMGMLEVKKERKTTVCFMGKDDKYVEIWKENKLIKMIDLS